MKISIQYKLMFFLVSLLLLLAVLLSFYFIRQTKQLLLKEYTTKGIESIQQIAFASKEGVLSQNLFNNLAPLIEGLTDNPNIVYIFFTDEKGKVIAHNHKTETGKTFKDTLTQKALASPKPFVIKENQMLHLGMNITAPASSTLDKARTELEDIKPVKVKENITGAVRIGINTVSITKKINRMLWISIVITFLIVISGFLCSYLFAKHFLRPVILLKKVAMKVGEGNFDIQAKIFSKDEMGVLTHIFNRMVRNLKKTTVTKEYLDNIMQTMTNMLVVANMDGIITKVNQTTLDTLHYREDEMVGKSCSLLIGKQQCEHSIEERKNMKQQEHVWVTKLGEPIPVLISSSVLYDKKDEIAGIIYIANDYRQRKKMEIEIENRNKELQTFMYRASHDLKAPVDSTLGLIQLMKSEFKDKTALHYIALMEQSIARLRAINLELIRIIKIKQISLNVTFIDFNAIIQDILQNIKHIHDFAQTNIQLHIHNKKPFYSDKELFNTIFQNLIDNAIKYRNTVIENSFVKITIEDDLRGICITIEDNGLGISSEFQDKIFDMFFRASLDSKGSGLGLYIVKTAVDRLKGRIQLISEEGKGTTFTLLFESEK